MRMNFDNIPKELRELDRWVCWKTETRDGKPTKVLKIPWNGKNAMSNEPKTWGSYEAALKGMEKFGFDGIGFVFNGDGITGIDIDGCRDPDTRQLNSVAADIIGTMDSYTEVSPSGKGIHIVLRAEFGHDKKETHYEPGKHLAIYTSKYFTMTGNILDDGHMEVQERTAELKIVYEKYINKQKIVKSENEKPVFVNKIANFVTENEVYERMSKRKKNNEPMELLNGIWSHAKYDSPSEADYGLMNHLAHYTDRNFQVAWLLFVNSGLFRPDEYKRNPKKYTGSLEKAIRECGESYTERRERVQAEYELRKKKKQKQQEQQEPPEIDSGLDALVQSVIEKPFEDTSSDMGRSRIFSSKHSKHLHWCGDIKSWLVWDGRRWSDDRLLYIVQLAKKMVDDMIVSSLKAISSATGEEEVRKAKQIFKDTAKAKSERSIKSMIELAKSDISIKVEDLDGNPFLLNCQNGIVDLRTGEIIKHDPKLMMSRITSANYVLGNKFELFGDFMKLITCGDTELINYLQQICGMAAIGKVFHEGMAVFYGNGQNGKSTFLNTISKAFGDYACSINPEMLMSQRDGRQPVGITRLDGKRFVTVMELEEGRRMSSSMLKQLASTDPITGRELYQKDRTFMPTHTLIMATNFLPKISSNDVGTWRRIAVVPFKAVVQSKSQIKDYANVIFQQDGDAILTWIVEGAIKYIKNNYHIKTPAAVELATGEYKAAEDWLGNFIFECCETGIYKESGGDLYEAYVAWCEKNNESFKRRARDFAAALEIAGYNKNDTKHGAVWDGLRLIGKEDYLYSGKWKKQKYDQSTIPDDDDCNPFIKK